MSYSKNDLHDLGNGWGWFISIDYIEPQKKPISTPHQHKIQRLKSKKSMANLHDLYKNNDNDYDNDYDNQKYSLWGVNAVCILSVVAFGFIIL